MRRFLLAAGMATLMSVSGCASGPLMDNPLFVVAGPGKTVENPVWVPEGEGDYGKVFEKVIDILDDYFEISYANRYDGRIETFPLIAPGFEQPWKPGSPDGYQRLLATLQTYRYRAVVLIQPANDGGFFIHVTVYRELEDLPQPSQQTAGAASFRGDTTVERQYEVIDAAMFESNWIPKGRESHLEQTILERLKKSL